MTVILGGVTQTTAADERQQWSVAFPALKASTQAITLEVKTSQGRNTAVKNILIGDVWFLTGSTLLTSEFAYDKRVPNAVVPEAMPLVREYRRRTAGNANDLPRKRGFETGGDRKYRSIWLTADFKTPDDSVTMFTYEFAKALNRHDIPQGFVVMSSGDKNNMASPLSWTSFAGVKDLTSPAFRSRIDALFFRNPNSEVSKKAITEYLKTLKQEVAKVADMAAKGANMSAAPLGFPGYPETDPSGQVKPDTVPNRAYNWCVSPLTPMGVSGVIWVPSQVNLGYLPADYSPELEIYARSLPATYGLEKVPFFYAQPSATLVPGITPAKIDDAKSAEFDQWPKSLKDIASQLGTAAR